MTPCLGPELPQTMIICLAMMGNMGGVRMLSVSAFYSSDRFFLREISGSVVLLEVTHDTDDLNKK